MGMVVHAPMVFVWCPVRSVPELKGRNDPLEHGVGGDVSSVPITGVDRDWQSLLLQERAKQI